jgi:purine-nucleoside phosphorylase
MPEQYRRAAGAARYIKQKIDSVGSLCIITGSGLDSILQSYTVIDRIAFSKIPHLNEATFHRGEFLVLEHNGYRFCALNGRLHYYEGYSAREVGFPIRIISLLGIKNIIMTNASGGLNSDYSPADIVMVRDHINLLPDNPLRGENDERFGLRFPDMSNAYDKDIRQQVSGLASELEIKLNQAVYICFQGPSLETPAEYNLLHKLGADVVGMSTVPEVIVANHCKMRVLVLSVVTNICIPVETITSTTVDEVIEVANRAVKPLSLLINSIIEKRLMH